MCWFEACRLLSNASVALCFKATNNLMFNNYNTVHCLLQWVMGGMGQLWPDNTLLHDQLPTVVPLQHRAGFVLHADDVSWWLRFMYVWTLLGVGCAHVCQCQLPHVACLNACGTMLCTCQECGLLSSVHIPGAPVGQMLLSRVPGCMRSTRSPSSVLRTLLVGSTCTAAGITLRGSGLTVSQQATHPPQHMRKHIENHRERIGCVCVVWLMYLARLGVVH